MTAKLLKKLPAKNEPWKPGPRCEADVVVIGMHEASWRKHKYGETESNRCTRDAVVEIDGRCLCRLHGGYLALDMLLDGRLVPGGDGGN